MKRPLMMILSNRKTLLTLATLLFVTSHSVAQQASPSVSARQALDQIAATYGAPTVQWVAEMRATGGQPQPLQWEVLTYDPSSSGLMHRFLVAPGRVQDGGPEMRRYPADVPAGFFTLESLGVDSVAAFTIAEAQARKAKIGFDSCDYFLRVREYSTETVWRLELVDSTHRMVGTVFVSGTNGEVLRTIWVERDTISGFPRVSDSRTPDNQLNFPSVTENSPAPVPAPERIPLEQPQAYSPVSPDGSITPPPIMTPEVSSSPRRGGIFRDFPQSGGGFIRRDNPVIPEMSPTPAPQPPVSPVPIEAPQVEPETSQVPTSPAPPISVPNGGAGSAERIPPPPVPGS